MTAQQIIASSLSDWGNERDLYHVSKEEFEIILLELGPARAKLNTPNGDGTFYSTIEVQGKSFCHSGATKINGQPSI